ncbi:MAG: hypothetical protein E8A46_12215, partial [Bradyrhizobium sp.]
MCRRRRSQPSSASGIGPVLVGLHPGLKVRHVKARNAHCRKPRSPKQAAALPCARRARNRCGALGVDVVRCRIQIFVLSAVYAALAGSLYAHFLNYVNGTFFDLGVMIQLMANRCATWYHNETPRLHSPASGRSSDEIVADRTRLNG